MLQGLIGSKDKNVQAGFRKGRGTRDQISNIRWIMEKARDFQKNIYFCFIDYAKRFDCMDHNKVGKFLKRWEYQTTLPVSWETYMQVKKQRLELDMEQWFPAMTGNPLVPPDQALSPSARIPDGVCGPVYYHSSVQVWAWFPVETRASITGIFPKHRVRINVVSKHANEHFF